MPNEDVVARGSHAVLDPPDEGLEAHLPLGAREPTVARVSYRTLHEELVPTSGIDAPPEDACLLDRHLTVARCVEAQERHLELPGGLVAGEEDAPQGLVGAEADDRAVELPARDGAGRPEVVNGLAVPRDPRGDQQLGPVPVRLLLHAEAVAVECPRPAGERDHDVLEAPVRPWPSQGGEDPVVDQGAHVRVPVELRLGHARGVRGGGEEVGDDGRRRRLAGGAAQRQRAVEAVPVTLGRDMRRRAAHRLPGHVRPGRPRVPAREEVPERGGLVGRPTGDERGAAEARCAPREPVADQVPADAGRRDLRGGFEFPEPVHEEQEPPVPVGRHLDLVHAAAEPPVVGPRPGQRLERRVAQRHSVGLGTHLPRRGQSPVTVRVIAFGR